MKGTMKMMNSLMRRRNKIKLAAFGGSAAALSFLPMPELACGPSASEWVDINTSPGADYGCQVRRSQSEGFVTVSTRCAGIQGASRHQQAGVRCNGEPWFQGGNMVYGNNEESTVSRFCGNGYEFAVMIYPN